MKMTCCNRENIAWDTDRSVRFQNPRGDFNVSSEDLIDTTRPPNWPRDLSEIPRGLENESLIVWYRVSAFPIFRKLYGRLEVNNSTDFELPAGDYSIILTYSILLYLHLYLSPRLVHDDEPGSHARIVVPQKDYPFRWCTLLTFSHFKNDPVLMSRNDFIQRFNTN